MAGDKPDVLLVGAKKPVMMKGFEGKVTLHHWLDAKDKAAFVKEVGDKIKEANRDCLYRQQGRRKLPSAIPQPRAGLELWRRLRSYRRKMGRGAWHRRHQHARSAEYEGRDTALGLLLCTVREFPSQIATCAGNGRGSLSAHKGDAARSYGRNGWNGANWQGDRAATRSVRRADRVPQPQPAAGRQLQVLSEAPRHGARRRHAYGIVPGGAGKNMINAEVLKALGPRGVLINMARGSVVDEPALIEALQNRTIYSAGLDVFANEPDVPKELIAMDHIVLFPHLGSSTEATRAAMDQLVVDNILAWAAGKPRLTPVPETPWPPK